MVPADKPVSRISLAINMPIVPESDIEQFMAEHVGHPVRVQRLEGTGRWRVADDHLAGRRHRARYSTARRTSAEILEAVLKNQPVTVYDTINGKPVHNADASAAANEACAQMRAAWGSWVWADAERMRRLNEAGA